MTKALNIDSFEHFFDEKVLKKGLSLFERNQIKVIDKSAGGNHVFLFKGKKQIELHLKKTGNKISSYSCLCLKEKECEHLCAALFYLSKDNLSIETRKTEETAGNKKGEILFSQYCNKLKEIIKRHKIEQLNHKNSQATEAKALEIIKNFTITNPKTNQVILHLSVLNEFSNFFSLKKNINQEDSSPVLIESAIFLSKVKPLQLTVLEKEAWLLATKNSLSNNKKFSTGIFVALISVASIIVNDVIELTKLKHELYKRNLKFNYPGNLDDKLMAYLQLLFAEQKFKNTKLEIKSYEETAEHFVAAAQIEFCLGQKSKGFKLLQTGHEKFSLRKPANYVSFVEYAIQRANEFKNKQTEIFFLKQLFIYDFLLAPKYLTRIKEIMNDAERTIFIDEIMLALRLRTNHDNFEKIVQILESENRLDELIREISKQINRFPLLNKTALKKLPDFDNFLLNNYLKHFIYAVSEARETYHQKELFDNALVYIRQLPSEVAKKLVEQMLEKISKSDFIYQYLKNYNEGLEAINPQA